jgi:hypothetical protein
MLFLYIVLLLCTIALVWTAAAIFVRVRKHLRAKHQEKHEEVAAP